MKAWLQRVESAKVETEGETIAEIGPGLLVLLGVAPGDTEASAAKIAAKIADLRIFEDANGMTNLSLADTGGSVIVVSQFTLYADTSRGRRPGFSGAARPEVAEPLYLRTAALLAERLGAERVKTGRFGTHMRVSLVNDGPFSVEILA